MASAYVQKRAPMILATTLLAQAAAATERLTDAKRLQFKLRLTKMLEQLAEVAILREAEMHDRTEAATLDAAVAALGDGDTQRALHVLSERRAHLARKEAAWRQQPSTDPLDDSDEDDDEEEFRGGHEGDSPHAAAPAEPVARGSLEDGEHWRSLAPGLHVCEEPSACEQAAAGGSSSSSGKQQDDFERRLPEFRASLQQDGYMQSEDPVVGGAALHALREGVSALQAAGWPPVCVFMYDEAWAAVAALWDRAEALMGGACVLEPSFTAFRLSHPHGPQGKYVGTNFALPHRDYTYAESTTAAGEPQLLSVWLPLNDVTLDNGCMYVVPREFDPNFQRDHTCAHFTLPFALL